MNSGEGIGTQINAEDADKFFSYQRESAFISVQNLITKLAQAAVLRERRAKQRQYPKGYSGGDAAESEFI